MRTGDAGLINIGASAKKDFIILFSIINVTFINL
jgi:hypothetical protein